MLDDRWWPHSEEAIIQSFLSKPDASNIHAIKITLDFKQYLDLKVKLMNAISSTIAHQITSLDLKFNKKYNTEEVNKSLGQLFENSINLKALKL